MQFDRRIAELEARIAAKIEAHRKAASPIAAFLNDCSTDELRCLEAMAVRLAEQGLMLALRPLDPLSREDIARMTPRQRADAYRDLIRHKGRPRDA